jgi:hypothetical protein
MKVEVVMTCQCGKKSRLGVFDLKEKWRYQGNKLVFCPSCNNTYRLSEAPIVISDCKVEGE